MMEDTPIILNLDANRNESDNRTATAINKLKNCMEMLLESQDRVDISLKEYETLKRSVAKLSKENEQMHYVLSQLGFELGIIHKIIPGTIKTYECESTVNIMECKKKVRIEFEYEGV